ncbi:MAG: ribokinase [Verrucomicrobiales bacterium]
MPRKFDVVVIGGVNSDFVIKGDSLPQPGQTVQGSQFFTGPGGKGANQAVATARLGARTAFIGKVGNDDAGRQMIQNFRKEGIDTSGVYVDKKEPTGAALINVDASGEKQINAYVGANARLTKQEITQAKKLLQHCSVLLIQFETPLPVLEYAARIARKAGATIVLDPAPPNSPSDAFLKLIDLIRPNADEARALTGIATRDKASARKAAGKLFAKGIKLVCCQAGDEGDLLLSESEEHFFPRVNVKSVDATGAGDAFAAGLAFGLAKGLPLKEVGAIANATAALATTKVGAQAALPRWSAVAALLRGRHAAKRPAKV